MSANKSPIFSRAPDVQWVNGYMTAANATADLTSGTIYLAFTADATEGGWGIRLHFRPTPAGNTTKTVARIWLNNSGATSVAANNVLLDEVTLNAVTADADDAAAGLIWALNLPLPLGYRIYITLGTASANGWACAAIGGKF